MLNWKSVREEYEEITRKLSESSLDHKTRSELQKRCGSLSDMLALHDEIEGLQDRIIQNNNILKDDVEPDLIELIRDENKSLQAKFKDVELQLDDILYPGDENNSRSVFMEIRSGAGGQEAALFVGDLFKMYNTYSITKGWVVSIVDYSTTDIGGYKDITVYIKGKNVYKNFKFESGVHRVQRVPVTEGSGRIHTSTVTVAVLPEVDDVEITINTQDIRVDVFRSQGAGGQSVNTTDSAVRIVHIPTGIVVSCQDERSQIKNKAKAMKVLRARIFDLEKQKRDQELNIARKKQIGSGQRSEKIRTYNFPQNRVSDHRINLTLKKLDMVISGSALDELIKPLCEWDVLERKKNTII
jgi:peptide chain release factor 1